DFYCQVWDIRSDRPLF
nr:immunoglobulin light chain junction region [Macaca mulatta]MOV66648.1 immunoglobulin light chain junction region [Macaca mulatta]MOV66689.1 immunoglobulin light chain junction region [Macaca mulatta]MOV66867.1 immunoglobulin light chain junction region [Macaca mulatta]MOV66988.1 immunoglobulin light chain junction region [Macaca mulatta]